MISKKHLISLLLALSFAAGASAQDFTFGLKGGIAANWMPGTYLDLYDVAQTNVGFYAGATGALNFDGSFFPQVEVLFVRKGVTTNNELTGKYSRNISYVQVPVYAGFKLADDRFRIMLGPEFGFCVGQNIRTKYETPAIIGKPAPFNFAFAIQTTYMIADFLGVDAKFDYGITRTLQDALNDNGRNMSLQIGLCVVFGD